MKMTRPRGVLRVAACLAVLSASIAFSTPARSQTPLDQAKALTGRATVEYNIGHFDQALELDSKAYESLAAAALLFDIGQCHRMLGHQERAVFFFQGYLREKPDAPNRALVEQLLQDLQRQLDAQRAATARAEEQQRAETSHAAPAPPVEPVAPVPPPTVASPKGHPAVRIAGLATAGAGVALIGTAVVLGLHASSLSNEITRVSTERGTWSPQYQSDYDAGKSSATAATVLSVAGGLALATGGVLTYLGWPRSGTEAGRVAAVAPAPGGASLVVAGRF
jgi:tetratricopeptide (TPR) repeat protein